MSSPHAAENTQQRERLVKLTAVLTEHDLTLQLPNGWTVATKLLHLAFWDEYCLALLKNWKPTTVSSSSLDVDAVNHAVRLLSREVAPQAVARLVRSAAEGVDREVEAINPELRAAIEASGRSRVLRRAVHRREHLDQIEQALRT